jgi:hypothetical protein
VYPEELVNAGAIGESFEKGCSKFE